MANTIPQTIGKQLFMPQHANLVRLSKTVDELKRAAQESGFNQTLVLAHLISHFGTGLESCLQSELAQPEETSIRLISRAVEVGLIPSDSAALIQDLMGFRDFVWAAYGTDFNDQQDFICNMITPSKEFARLAIHDNQSRLPPRLAARRNSILHFG
jgi:hypothetical protein